MYPLEVIDEVGATPKGAWSCADENAFLEALTAILRSAEVRKIVAALLAQSIASKE
jgi:hypothetical protein